MENKIKLVQAPVIAHELQKAGKKVSNRIAKLDIKNQVATIDTVKALKSLRAELNKELSDFEDQRKFIKNGVNNPYNEFESVYKVEISEKYKEAIDELKDKISSVEIEIKEKKEADIKLYFIELCQSEDIDFLIFDNVGLEINLSTTEKSYKESCNKFVAQVCNDIDLIKTLEFEAEIMAEYKTTLNASKSIQDVKDRKERERQEEKRIKIIEQNRRIAEFKNIGMSFDSELKTFTFNEEIYITSDKIKDISKEDFESVIIDFEEKIKSFKKSQEKPIEKKEEQEEIKKAPVQKTIEKLETKKPLKAPKKETKLEIVTASFEVRGTMPQLKALSEYMKTNNINYKNI